MIERKRSTIDEFLRTGSLRGITEGTSFREIGEKLGPPTQWGDQEWEFNIPLLWKYGDVEVIFSREKVPKVSGLTLNKLTNGATFKSSKLIRNVAFEPYPDMTFDDFERYAKNHGHSLSEHTWSFQDQKEERAIIVDDATWIIFAALSDEDDQYRLYEIHSSLEGMPDFFKDPRSRYYKEYRAKLEQGGSGLNDTP